MAREDAQRGMKKRIFILIEEENLMQNKKPGKGRLKKKISVFQELH